MRDVNGTYYGMQYSNITKSQETRVFSNARTLNGAVLRAIKAAWENPGMGVTIYCVVRDGTDRCDKRVCKVNE